MYEKKCTSGEGFPDTVASENPYDHEAYHLYHFINCFTGQGS